MKKYLTILFVFALIMFIPMVSFADEEAYEYFDFKVDRLTGSNIKNTDIKIYASLTSDLDTLIDRTNEFNIEEVMWSVCDSEDCSTFREVDEDAVFEDNQYYVFMIRITALNGADINVWGTDRAKLNGTPIEELDGEFGNTGSELMIKSKTGILEVPSTVSEPVETIGADLTPAVENTNACMLGLPFCCQTFLGLSICIWILIIIVFILVIIILCAAKSKDKKQE